MAAFDPSSVRVGPEIGRGALGRVVELHTADGGVLAGKILHPSQAADERSRARFRSEAEIAAKVRHPAVARVEGLFVIEGQEVLVMERADGRSLGELLTKDGPMPAARVARIGAELAEGLAAAHHAGLIHRDLKPDNVRISADDHPKLLDFGMARATSFAGVDVSAFAVVGTPDYMAPEAVDPLAVDARSDLYSLGCLLFEMLAGQPPFAGSTAFAVLEAHRDRPIPALPADCDRALAALVTQLLAKSPADRPQSAAAVASALRSESRALAPVPSRSGQCAGCGAAVVIEVGVCFGCGERRARLEPGGWTVFVTGPGEIGDKLDSSLRQALIEWIEGNAGVGLLPGRLSKSVPRVPFVIALGVSEGSARILAGELESLGLSALAREGGRFSLPAVRKKGLRVGGRVALIAFTTMFYGFHQGLGAVVTVPLMGLGALVGGFVSAGRHAAKQNLDDRPALPDAVSAALARIAGGVPAIHRLRHRDSLRAVVQRALQLREGLDDTSRAAMDGDLAQLLDRALIGVSRMDEIDAELETADMRNASDAHRQLLLERDAWSSRLLEMTAFLDALRARYAILGTEARTPGELDELRSWIEALEEVESL